MTTGNEPERTTRRTPAARVLSSASRVELLHVLQDEGPSTTPALAARTGLHENTVREHLQRLVDARFVVRETERRTTRGRPRTVYRATTRDDVRTDPTAARHLAESVARARLTRVLLGGYGAAVEDVPASARRAGREMVDELPALPAGPRDQVLALEAHLDRLGFDPVLDASGTTFDLWRCPFLDLARTRPDVVCSVHLGLAQGVLEQVGGPVRAERLVPFVGPRHCELHLSEVGAADVPSPARAARHAPTEGEP
ncbi:helix-turn-helix transcriptional regulator [Cellulomonas xiejunii]|uniref:Helix-turn-helix domain-containing protein n=1 Tax=Cellulomonas xiejunii TaxID=2968083 RepID=A0ABY5KUM9_9CELL|nr:helix-turn-helix domain-containing protein [Cellulomonas xiejunii]MCC2323032.1 helix-turn-helix domain-containing protein [Cellulomonas xiejunii]UUI73528.1 helix-turn-helix domain-containing protein [Cellulomonas xiejunii]